MSDTKLGQLIGPDAKRDAIHIAIAPVAASTMLMPGQHVGIVNGVATPSDKPIGIVDPFLTTSVKTGEYFWLCLYQQTVTGMRHHWAHPAFNDSDGKFIGASEKWIRDYAEEKKLHYEELMSAAHEFVDYGEYFIQGGRFEGWGVPDEFWTHFAVLTGKKGDGSFFSCSC